MILKNHLICGFPSQVIHPKTGRSPHSFASPAQTLYLVYAPFNIFSSSSSEGKSKCISELANILKLFGVQLPFLNQKGPCLFPRGRAIRLIIFFLFFQQDSKLTTLLLTFYILSVSPGMVCREIR